MSPLTYRDAGVDIDAGATLVERIRPALARTRRPEVLGAAGGFGACCGIPAGYREPVLVSGADGVGTKLAVAQATGRHDTIGIDLVAMCANDVATSGAEPLFFLDYFACGRLEVEVAARVVAGIAEGCRRAGCALVGGETAEMPGFYPDGAYDLAGFCVGVVERDAIVDGARIRPGDRVVGVASNGLHANGFALARRILGAPPYGLDARPPELGGRTVAEELLRPARIYAPLVRRLVRAADVRGVAHVTGGGLVENPPRILPPGVRIALRAGSWPVPPIFDLLARAGDVAPAEMRRTFNLGLGLLVVVPPESLAPALSACRDAGEPAWEVGEVRPGEAPVEFAE